MQPPGVVHAAQPCDRGYTEGQSQRMAVSLGQLRGITWTYQGAMPAPECMMCRRLNYKGAMNFWDVHDHIHNTYHPRALPTYAPRFLKDFWQKFPQQGQHVHVDHISLELRVVKR